MAAPATPLSGSGSAAVDRAPTSNTASIVSTSKGGKVLDNVDRAKRSIGFGQQKLCSKCAGVNFQGCLRGHSTINQYIYLTDVDQILALQASCPCCALFLKCLRQPENDWFEPDHMRAHLESSNKLKGFRTFNDLLSWHLARRGFDKLKSGEDVWPFGYIRDTGEARGAMEEAAKKLFVSAESHDIDARGSFSNIMSTQDAVNDALHLDNLSMNVVNVAKPGFGRREVAGAKLALSEVTSIFGRVREKLPCCLTIRAYGAEEAKAAAVSVRAFAFGRGARAALKELYESSCKIAKRGGMSAEERGKTSEGPGVFYQTTFEVHFDSEGLALNLRSESEERMHPWASIFSMTTIRGKSKLVPYGLLSAPWAQKASQGSSVEAPNESAAQYKDWESSRLEEATKIPLDRLDGRCLLVCTEEVILYLGSELFGAQRYISTGGPTPVDLEVDANSSGDPETRERWLFEDAVTQQGAGIATYVGKKYAGRTKVRAIVLPVGDLGTSHSISPLKERARLQGCMLSEETEIRLASTEI